MCLLPLEGETGSREGEKKGFGEPWERGGAEEGKVGMSGMGGGVGGGGGGYQDCKSKGRRGG